MIKATGHRYIVTDSEILNGEPIIAQTRTPVRAIVEMWRNGTAPEEISQGLPHLTLAQIFDALSYYSDNQEEINKYIELNRIPDELIKPLVKIESHEKAGLFVRVNRSFTAELREYLNEIRFPFAVNAAQFNDIQRMEEQDVIFFGNGVKRAAVWEVLCGFFDGIAKVQ